MYQLGMVVELILTVGALIAIAISFGVAQLKYNAKEKRSK